MLALITSNILPLNLILLVGVFSWIHGGTRPDLLLPNIPWVTLLVAEVLLIFPQTGVDETLIRARQRVWRSLARDPLLYLMLLLAALLIIPLFNATGEPMFNVVERVWQIGAPPFKYLPFCVDPWEHASLLLWFIPVLVATLAVRHGLQKRGQRLVLMGLCWNGGVLALFGFLQMATGAQSVWWGEELYGYFFATFGYPNFAGAFFTLLFALSAGVWFNQAHVNTLGPMAAMRHNTVINQRNAPYWLIIPMLLNLAGAITSLSRAAILLSAALVLILGVYMLLGAWQVAEYTDRIKLVATLVGFLFCAGLGSTTLAPESFKKEVATITPQAITERVSGTGYYHADMARRIHADYPFFGVGGWGYPHFTLVKATAQERQKLQIAGGANVHNDTLQFLAEQGWVGFSLLVLCALCVVVPPLRQTIIVNRNLTKYFVGTKVRPRWLYLTAPVVVAGCLGALATVGHSLGDLPFRCPAILSVWFLGLACLPGFLPKINLK